MVKILSDLGWRFNVEHPQSKDNIIVDFMIPAHHLVIEVDGGYHLRQKDRDRQRDRRLVKRGYLVQRFTNEQILNFPRKTAATLRKRITPPNSKLAPRRIQSVRRAKGVFVPDPPMILGEFKCGYHTHG
jgi:very-short-patch-repair endonuclease